MIEGKKKKNKTLLCLPYDIIDIYDFWCARYQNISYEEFLNIGISEFDMKIKSIPENEPLYTIIKSRAINLSKIKDKNEKKYWQELKKINKIPYIYLSTEELDNQLKSSLQNSKYIGGK